MNTIELLSEIRSKYSCFDEEEEPYYRALSEAIAAIRELPFSAIRKICKHYTISRDMYGSGQWEDACHHPEVTSSGDSWGKCSKFTCPLYEERRTDES